MHPPLRKPTASRVPFLPALLATGIAAAGFPGCNMLNLDPSGKTRPATEETVEGTWRNAEPDAEGRTVRMTLRIDTGHSMVWARRISGVVENGDWEYQRETWSWEVADGKLKAVKNACEYAAPEGAPLVAETCRAPTVYEIPIVVNGNAWKISEGDRVMLFRKD